LAAQPHVEYPVDVGPDWAAVGGLNGADSGYLRANPLDFVPRWSDELLYWHQSATFEAVGFAGGYYTASEQPAAAAFTHFYVHGPLFPLINGSIGRVIGWAHYIPVFLNMGWLTLALAAFVALIRPANRQLILALLVIGTCWAVHTFVPSAMQESLHQAAGIVLAGLFYRLLKSPDDSPPQGLVIALGSFLTAISLLRVTWALLFLPFFLLVLGYHSWRVVIRAVVLSGVVMGAIFLLTSWLGAPYENFTTRLIRALREAPLTAPGMLVDHAVQNTLNFFRLQMNRYELPSVVLRYQIVVVLGVMLVQWRRAGLTRERLFHLSNLGLITLMLIMLYDVDAGRDYRVLIPHLLLSMLVLVGFHRRWLPVTLVIMSMTLATFFMIDYKTEGRRAFVADQAEIDAFAAQVGAVLVYDPAADPWCNTVLLSFPNVFRQETVGIPAGFGVSHFIAGPEVAAVRSGYVLLDDDSYAALADRLPLDLLAETALGGLYANLDAGCAGP
jgi:hypothetical protein